MIRERRFAESPVRKRSIKIGGRTTSVALEDKFWEAISEIALLRNLSIRKLVTAIDEQHEHTNLSSAIRVFVLDHYMTLANRKTNDTPNPARTAAPGHLQVT